MRTETLQSEIRADCGSNGGCALSFVVGTGWRLGLAGAIALGLLLQAYGQGTLLITFDGAPVLTPGSAVLVQSYSEYELYFQPLGQQGFARVASDPAAPRPDSGSAYLQAGLGSTLMFSRLDGGTFDFLSVDLAEYSTVVPDAVTVQFIGYFADGTTISQTRTTDGIIDGTGPIADFQTFAFRDWTGLTRVEIPTWGWSLDNVRVGSVPEPGTGALTLLGAALLALRLAKRRK